MLLAKGGSETMRSAPRSTRSGRAPGPRWESRAIRKRSGRWKAGWEIGAIGKVFVFFSNRLGCAGSLLVTVVLSALLFVPMRGCSGPPNVFWRYGKAGASHRRPKGFE